MRKLPTQDLLISVGASSPFHRVKVLPLRVAQ